jgi:Lrp/AsnC family leucine-responsive transcriptional regulator
VRYGDDMSLPSERRQRRSSAYEGSLLDAIDRRILIELQDDGRVTMAELGRRVSLSAPAVGERVQRLEESGVITGYSAVVDPRAIGYPIAALVRIRPARRQLHKVPEVARSTPEVVECHRVTGEDCYVAKLHLRSMDDLEGILDRFAAVGQTTTSIVHSAPVAGRPLPLLDDPVAG